MATFQVKPGNSGSDAVAVVDVQDATSEQAWFLRDLPFGFIANVGDQIYITMYDSGYNRLGTGSIVLTSTVMDVDDGNGHYVVVFQ